MLDAEAALTWALADVGLAPVAHAEAMRCAAAEGVRRRRAGRDATAGGNPVIPLVRALDAPGSLDGGHPPGATSQDILDTAAMLVARKSLDSIIADLERRTTLLVDLARTHALADGRTHAAAARRADHVPLVAAGWAAGSTPRRAAGQRARRPARRTSLASGNARAFGGHGIDLAERFAHGLGPAGDAVAHRGPGSPSWPAPSAAAAGAIGKVATDIVLLAQTEVAEVRRGGEGRGASSAMPHKGNLVAAISAGIGPPRARTRRPLLHHAPRAPTGRGRARHAEWRPSPICSALSAGAAWLRESLEHLMSTRANATT